MTKNARKHRVNNNEFADLRTALANLATLDRNDLMSRWRSIYNEGAPANISRPLLLNAIAYRLQEQSLGGLSAITLRALTQIAANGRPSSLTSTNVRSGTRLLREWHGTTHEVMVTDDGVMFKGKRYRSLSEVAFAITGTKWSGPLFFGLRKKSND